MRKRPSSYYYPQDEVTLPPIADRFDNVEGQKKCTPKMKKYILVLLFPILAIIITFLLGILLMSGASPSQNAGIMNIAVAALLVTTTGYITAPSYLVGVLAYALTFKKLKHSPLKLMWLIPLVQLLFVWFPSYIKMPKDAQTWTAFFALAGSTFVFTSLYIGILQLVIAVRRKQKKSGK